MKKLISSYMAGVIAGLLIGIFYLPTCYAQNFLQVSPSETVYLCQGKTYTILIDLSSSKSPCNVASATCYSWTFSSTGTMETGNFGAFGNSFTITAQGDCYATAGITPNLNINGTPDGSDGFNLHFYAYSTHVAGPTQICGNPPSSLTYTASTNLPIVNHGNWIFPSFMTGTGPGPMQLKTRDSAGIGEGTISFEINTAVCPSTSASVRGSLIVNSWDGVPFPPCCLHYMQVPHNQCYFYPIVKREANAHWYIWGPADTTLGPGNSHDEILGGGYCTLPVSCLNGCGMSSHTFSGPVPRAPNDCLRDERAEQEVNSEAAAAWEFGLYPNPAQDVMTLRIPENEIPLQLEIRNGFGSLIKSLFVTEPELTIDTGNLPPRSLPRLFCLGK